MVRHNGRDLTCRPQDLRLHIAYLAFLAAPTLVNSFTKAMTIIRQAVALLQPGRIVTLGLVKHGKAWIQSKETAKYNLVWNAAQYLSTALPDVVRMVSAIIGRNAATLPPYSSYPNALLLTWPAREPDRVSLHWIEPKSYFSFNSLIVREEPYIFNLFLYLLQRERDRTSTHGPPS